MPWKGRFSEEECRKLWALRKNRGGCACISAAKLGCCDFCLAKAQSREGPGSNTDKSSSWLCGSVCAVRKQKQGRARRPCLGTQAYPVESLPDGTPREEDPLQMFKQPQLRYGSPSLEEKEGRELARQSGHQQRKC